MSGDNSSVRVGIVGLGTRGLAHAKYVRELGHEVAGGVDVDAAARRKFERECDAPAFDDRADLYREGIDAIEIVTPNRFHESAALEAFDRRIDVFLEKPLAHTVESAEQIARAARRADGVSMVGFNDRFRSTVRILESYVERGMLGEITHVEVSKVRRRGMPDRGSWFTRRDLAGGGALVDIGGHALNAGLAFLGFPPVVDVFGVTRSTFGQREDYADPEGWQSERDSPRGPFDVEDSASAILRTPEGASLSLDVAWATNRDTKREIVVCGTEAGARISGDTLSLFEVDAESEDHFRDSEIRRGNDVWEAVEEAFLDAVATGTQPSVNTVEQALGVQRVIDGIYRSADRCESVRVDVGKNP